MDYLNTHTSLSTIRRGFAPGFVNYTKGCTRLAAASDKVDQLLAHGRWFSPASSTTKTGRHDITEILLEVVLNTKNPINQSYYQARFQIHRDSKMPVNCPSQERPSLFKGHFFIAKGMALQEGDYWFYKIGTTGLVRGGTTGLIRR